EFRHRSLLNLIHFWIAFQLYSLDHVNIVWAFVHWDNPRGDFIARIIFGFGALLVGLAATIRTWATAYLRSEVVHDKALHTETLVADGPYGHVRNPLYLGTFLMSVGLGLLASRSGFVVLAAGAAIRILRLIRREEAELEKQQGESFREFCRRVPRMLPSLSPRIPAAGLTPQWGQAFRGEATMWGFFLTMAGFTITLQDRVANIIVGATLVLWFFERALFAKTAPA
ncbi:MAG TPA: isoprenylcysteine carboxylmethyltransferase family protein, partial [Candidatus Dormibacteraeota bacterium]|nr:isoprenylcysteine carboxylmethyltransferase family protein [Candidatus Dormibacteraeota bacterium]